MASTSLLLLGFLLGMRHALDPDHVVAVTTIVSREGVVETRAVDWGDVGVGHSATVILVGGAIALFKVVVPPNLVLGLELCVALMLIALGVANVMTQPREERALGSVRPLTVGFIHGLAGSAFIAMLISTALPTPMIAGWYLLLFGVGTIVGMMLTTSAIALPGIYLAGRYQDARQHLRLASGVASIAFGLFLAHQGVTSGLFDSVSAWMPQ